MALCWAAKNSFLFNNQESEDDSVSFVTSQEKEMEIIRFDTNMRNMNNRCVEMLDQPDPDAIKMFVGQIPRSMDEEKLRQMFEEFGKVHQINVLRDKVTSQSKAYGG
ncbi:Hypothetical predicted protein [Cloeon dipterum]|uniref:RRM domain-containing protein n=1 Tax=Cloeon dipterum TaxID=197152 RepID=A0A8S1CXZ1_9INSE|nr:Hypothetical predicted protein [Cloeon dipterum]